MDVAVWPSCWIIIIIIIRILLIDVRRRGRRRAVAPTNNTASHDYHEKSSSRVSISVVLRLAALRAAGASLLFAAKTHLDGITHEQTIILIICRQLFAGHVVGSQPMKRGKSIE